MPNTSEYAWASKVKIFRLFKTLLDHVSVWLKDLLSSITEIAAAGVVMMTRVRFWS